MILFVWIGRENGFVSHFGSRRRRRRNWGPEPISAPRRNLASVSVRWLSGCKTDLLVLLNKGNLKLKEGSKAIVGSLLHRGHSRNGSGKYGDAPPLRAELFSAEQMKQHGRTLAGLHKLSPGRAPDQLLARL